MNRKEADGVKDVKRLAAGLLAIFFITAALSGCSAVGLDVENKLRPPKGTGEQEAIQQALETYIRKYVDNSGSYLLKYPQSGEHRSAFLVDDFDGDGQQEAYAFYRPGLSDKENRKDAYPTICARWKTNGSPSRIRRATPVKSARFFWGISGETA